MNKLIRKITIAVSVMLMAVFGTITVSADEVLDVTRSDCSLNVTVHYGGNPVPGGTLTLYRVGDVVADGGGYNFAWKSNLNCTLAMDRLESAETAAAVMDYVSKQEMPGTTVNVDSNGNASFSNLGVGLYLIAQKSAAHGYTTMKPFLISLPQMEDDHYFYNVTTLAKSETVKVPGTPPVTPKKPGNKLPQTGQLNWPVPMLVLVGATLIMIGSVTRKRKETR